MQLTSGVTAAAVLGSAALAKASAGVARAVTILGRAALAAATGTAVGVAWRAAGAAIGCVAAGLVVTVGSLAARLVVTVAALLEKYGNERFQTSAGNAG